MSRGIRLSARLLLAGMLILQVAATASAAALRELPLGERWFTLRMQDELVGFVRLLISRTGEGYDIAVDSGAKMRVLGFTREASARERYRVGTDFTLTAFSVEQTIDRSPLSLTGRMTPGGISAKVTAGGRSRDQVIPVKGAVYPPPLLNIYPLLAGGATGDTWTVRIFDPEEVAVKTVTIRQMGVEAVGDVPAFRFRNNLYPVVENDVWVDGAGNTLRESVRNGLIETRAESAVRAREALMAAAVAKRDLVFDFSLVRLERPLERQGELTRLVVELSGFPATVALVEGPGQKAERVAADRVRLVRSLDPLVGGPAPGLPELVASTPQIPADSPEIAGRLREIVGEERDPLQIVRKISTWVAAHLADTVTDGQSALDSMRMREGNCVSHARLFVALARAAGLPSRMVGGLVHMPGTGFLYHAWAEVHAGNAWLAVDPTFDQVPADLTHLKLAEGDFPRDFTGIAGLMGTVKARVVETLYSSSP